MMPKTSLKFKLILLTIIFFAFFALAGSAEATTRVISPTGEGTACSNTAPCLWTDAYRLSQANDVIQFKGGTYTSPTRFIVSKSYLTLQNYPGETPVIDGAWKRPGVIYEALLEITGNYIVVDGLTIKRSTDRGINFEFTTGSTLRNCKVDQNDMQGAVVGSRGRQGSNIIENNEFSRNNWCWIDEPGVHPPSCRTGWTSLADNMVVRGKDNIIRKNIIRDSVKYGVELALGGEDTIFEYNQVYGNKHAQVYTHGCKRTIIRYNLIYGTPNGRGYGIGIEAEDWSGMCSEANYLNGLCGDDPWDRGTQAYGNVIAGTWNGLQVQSQKYYLPITDISVYNNIFIESTVVTAPSWQGNGALILSANLGTGNVIKNNIFWQESSDKLVVGDVDSAKVTMGNNLWNKTPNMPSFKSTTDPGNVEGTYHGGNPLTMSSYFSKTSGWLSLVNGELTGAEFALKSTAANARGKGANLGAPYNHLLNLAASNFKTKIFNFKDQPAAGAWDIGAGVYVGGDTTAPGAPGGLSVR